jgi:cell division protein FtsB
MIIRVIAGVLFAALLALQYRLWISDDGMRDVWRLESAITTQRQENDRLRERNLTLSAEVRDLKDGTHGDRGTGTDGPRHDRRERNILPGGAAGRGCATTGRRGTATGKTG